MAFGAGSPLIALLLGSAAALRATTEFNGRYPALRVARPEEHYELFEDGPQGKKVDWYISKAVNQWFPTKVIDNRSGAVSLDREDGLDVTKERNERLWVFGSHNKAGTSLAFDLSQHQANNSHVMMCVAFGKYGYLYKWCKNHDPRIWFLSDLTAEHLQNFTALGRSFRAVNMVRDPLAMVISGYMLHLHTDDTPQELLVIRNMTTAEGLALEADFQLKHGIRSMVDTYLNAPQPQTLHVRFENFALSPESYDAEVRKVYTHTLGDLVREMPESLNLICSQAQGLDIARNPLSVHGGLPEDVVDAQVAHIAAAMPKDLLERLLELRKTMGYA